MHQNHSVNLDKIEGADENAVREGVPGHQSAAVLDIRNSDEVIIADPMGRRQQQDLAALVFVVALVDSHHWPGRVLARAPQ